jgi:hypothetical protein
VGAGGRPATCGTGALCSALSGGTGAAPTPGRGPPVSQDFEGAPLKGLRRQGAAAAPRRRRDTGTRETGASGGWGGKEGPSRGRGGTACARWPDPRRVRPDWEQGAASRTRRQLARHGAGRRAGRQRLLGGHCGSKGRRNIGIGWVGGRREGTTRPAGWGAQTLSGAVSAVQMPAATHGPLRERLSAGSRGCAAAACGRQHAGTFARARPECTWGGRWGALVLGDEPRGASASVGSCRGCGETGKTAAARAAIFECRARGPSRPGAGGWWALRFQASPRVKKGISVRPPEQAAGLADAAALADRAAW